MRFIGIVTTTVLLVCAVSAELEIISFTQSAGAVTPDGSITFNCRANGDEAEWRVNNIPKFSSEVQNGFTISDNYQRDSNPQWILSLTMQGMNNNGSKVSCYASNSRVVGQFRIENKYFIIGHEPLPPNVTVQVQQNGTSLNIIWEEPFHFEDFSITGYQLDMVNKTTGARDVLSPRTTALSYVISMDETVIGCHELNFSVTAMNSLGNATGHVLGIFPKVPEPFNLDVDVSFSSNGTPRFQITVHYSDPCLPQGVQYTIRVINSNSELVREFVYDLTNEQDEREYVVQVDSGLVLGETYSVVAIGTSLAGSSTRIIYIRAAIELTPSILCDINLLNPTNGQVYVEHATFGLLAIYTCNEGYARHGSATRTCLADRSWSGTVPTCSLYALCGSSLPDPPNGRVNVTGNYLGSEAVYSCFNGFFNGSRTRMCQLDGTWSGSSPECNPIPKNGQTDKVAIGVAAGMSVVVAILGSVIVTVGIYCACKHHKKAKGVGDLQRRDPPNNIKLSNTLAQKCATNPIYEGGPLYESPTGEPFKALLGSTPSTPSTPSADSPRYFNIPPQLPPPRKSSVSMGISPYCTPQPSVAQVEKIQASFNAEVPSASDEYTIMRPVRSLSRPNKPSPLVIPNSPLGVSKPTIEEHGEYVSIT